MDGYKTLKAGQPVTFDTVNGPKGLHATNIQAALDSADNSNPRADDEIREVSSSQLD